MFCFICVLWSFWTSESIFEWFSLWKVVGENFADDVGIVPVILAAVLVGGLAGGRAAAGGEPKPGKRKPARLRGLAITVASLLILLVLGIESVYTHFGPTVASVIQPLRSGRLSRLDTAALERGYYENLLQVNRFNSQLWEVYSKRPANWLDIEGGGLKRHVDGFVQVELIPAFVSSTNYGIISTNRWGMRDQDYELQRPADTYRVALLGPSNVMGWGVGDGETFEALLESRLNRESNGTPFAKYEILNFGVQGYQPPQQLAALDKALAFDPTAVFYVATGRESSRAARYLVEAVQKRIEIPYPALQAVVAKAVLDPGMDEATALRRIAPFHAEILTAVYQGIAEQCRSRGIVPVWIFLPQVRQGRWQEETPEMLRIAQAAGFVMVDLGDIYKGVDVASIRLAEWDHHPNQRGHELIAARLYHEFHAKRDVLLPSSKTAR
jgi:rhodanese-related sulfurtransferase